MLRDVPLALYVHLPWCVRKCPYCDFNSHVQPPDGVPQKAYVAALVDDLDFESAGCEGRPVRSIFLGGGTPSLFEPEAIARLVGAVRQRLDLVPDAEVTMEANPGTIERGRFAEYRDAGVNRVSLGAQSFDDRKLAALGRIHAAAETHAAVEELRAAGLDNFNLDLMYALPQQSIDEALSDLREALALDPAHLSHYQLTLEPNTAFERRPPPLPDADACYEMQLACQSLIASSGFVQYEVSAYARPGRRCAHNLNYWTFGDYIGIGAGAHGKLTDTRTGTILRRSKTRNPARFLGAKSPRGRVDEERIVAPRERAFEFMLNALRLVEGFEESLFESRTGLEWTEVAAPAGKALSGGLLERTVAGTWRPTARGRNFLNDLQALFLPVDEVSDSVNGSGRAR
jgi:oxygen-independent coproporphyrinogen-3 oxidase